MDTQHTVEYTHPSTVTHENVSTNVYGPEFGPLAGVKRPSEWERELWHDLAALRAWLWQAGANDPERAGAQERLAGYEREAFALLEERYR